MEIQDRVAQMKWSAPQMAASSLDVRNEALALMAEALQEHAKEIFAANERDLAAAASLPAAVQKRLRFDQHKLEDCLAGIAQLIQLPDPTGRHLLDRQLDQGLELHRISVPIGLIGVIFEARPDAMVQISALCVKSGNCAVLKGGSETAESNRILFSLLHEAMGRAGLPMEAFCQIEGHEQVDALLACDKEIDLLIPRGSNAFVRYIMDHTKIPVMGHADGVCHIYVDQEAKQEQALDIIIDAKTQYTAACNSVESILVDRAIAGQFLPKLQERMHQVGVLLRGDEEICQYIPAELMPQEDYGREYLDLIASVKLVGGVQEACEHINRYGSHHTDAILTENDANASYFMQMVDSAGVYRNCSTRFADGFRYGFGAEVGISTSKLHARGPVGLEGMVTYKYQLIGQGQIVADYASGRSQFDFQDL